MKQVKRQKPRRVSLRPKPKKLTAKKIWNEINKSPIEVKVKLPIWFLILIILLPVIAYADTVMNSWSKIGYTFGFGYYVVVSALELFFLWAGYLIGVNRKL